MAGLHTELVGTGRPRFAFLPGLFGRGRNWSQVAQALAAEGYASVLFDLPDHGQSAWTTEFSYPGMAQAVADELDLRLGSAANIILVGHSMGGKVAMLTALNHPELVAALVVIDIAPGASDQVHTFGPLVAAMRSLDLAALTSRADADERMRAAVPDDAVRLFLLQNLRRKGGWHWQQNLSLLGDSLARIGDWPDPGDVSYPGPVLWLTGDRSDYVKPEHAATMTRLFPAVNHQVVADAGHWVHADQPQAVIDALLAVADEAGVSRP
ncbi:MAG TPA: alpha/beta fold hydrolase [Propionicimonas sp.]|jgi:pimeloyl-ACP methyl ester carboxylesterase|uniref:alpha/beta fold hydrolase n=1 Tax=Propionicimonas sp. TaxID=1955623 RepID=UPI002F40126E